MQQYCEIPTPKGIMRGFFHVPVKESFPVCIIFHGFTGCNTGTKFSYVQIARLLEAQGIGTIRMDFLGSGESDLMFKDMTFADELSCARVILEEMQKLQQVTDIYVLGHSMGGAIASELAKLYPNDIKKMCLWAPALNLPVAIEYLKGNVAKAKTYDHSGFEISDEFVEDITARDFYKDLDIYKNELLVIHGTKDTTVPFDISNIYLKKMNQPRFESIENATHNFDNLDHIQTVIKMTYHFFIES